MSISWTLADQARLQLQTQLDFLLLVLALHPTTDEIDEARTTCHEMRDWLSHAPDDEVLAKVDYLYSRFYGLVEFYVRFLKPRRPWQFIADEFVAGLRAGTISWSYGVEWHWLRERFGHQELESLTGTTADFPLHGTIGLGLHSGSQVVEESLILLDTFFLLVKVKRSYRQLVEMLNSRTAENQEQFDSHARHVNLICCGLARICVATAFSFFECFVNSVGESELKARQHSKDETEILSGRRGRTYVRLEVRLEQMPPIISQCKTCPIKALDLKQRTAPFKELLTDVRDLRDASAHYGRSKERIWLRPKEWMERSEQHVRTCVEAALIFWKACFPGSDGPAYLDNLDWTAWMNQAEKLAEADTMKISDLIPKA